MDKGLRFSETVLRKVVPVRAVRGTATIDNVCRCCFGKRLIGLLIHSHSRKSKNAVIARQAYLDSDA